MPTGVVRASFDEALRVLDGWHLDDAELQLWPGSHWLRERPELPVRPARDASAGEGPLARAAAAVQRGEVTARECVAAALDRAREREALGGYAHLDAEGSMAEAAERDRQRGAGGRGRLWGAPVGIKDVIHVAGMPTCCGSDAYRRTPAVDAGAVRRLRAAGAVPVGKTSTHEFALGVTTPQARNPHDASRVPGGSSGGSAIAVAVGAALGALGTDTRASIRNPSALSGTVGLKATLGAVPTDGVVPLSWTMDHVGPLAASVDDAALMMDVLAGADSALASYAGASVRGLRVGVCEAAFADCHPGVAAAVRAALAALEAEGARLEVLARPSADDLALANAAGLIISRCEAAAFHERLGTDRSRLWPETRDQLEEARSLPAHVYVTALRARQGLAYGLLDALAAVDAAALPTSLVPAPRVEEAERYLTVLSRNCIPWSLVGFPALSVPCRDRADGLPVGLQLVARPHLEPVLVALGSAYQRL